MLKLLLSLLVGSILINPSHLFAGSIVVSEGVAVVTSGLDSSTFRKRAIENALQKIANDSGQAISSFTIVENGQILLDQIQSISHSEVAAFEVISEKKTNSQYKVKIKALVSNTSNASKAEVSDQKCRKAQIKTIDFEVKIEIDEQQFPAWLGLDAKWLENNIMATPYSPPLSLINPNSNLDKGKAIYSLYSASNSSVIERPINQLNLRLKFDKATIEKLFVETIAIQMTMNTELLRKEQVIRKNKNTISFNVKSKIGRGSLYLNNRGSWDKEKNNLVNSITEYLKSELLYFQCVVINTELRKDEQNSFYINYGSLDGINNDDIFLLETQAADKVYLTVNKIDDHRTELSLLAKSKKLDFSIRQRVKLVDKLQ